MTTVADVVALLERWYDPERAAPWDTVGLATGDPAAAVRAIHLAVDPTVAVALEAKAADLLITHHPLWLGGTRSVARGTRHGEVLSALDGRALLVAHTNADVANPGVSDALGAALGLAGLRPLTPGATVGLGRVGDLPEALALSAFCACVAAALPRTVTGVRATGDPAATVRTVAVAGGSALELADLAYDIGADVLVTSDAKHHRALEAPIPVVDVAHWAGEWPWTRALGGRLRAALPGVAVTVSELATDPWTLTV